MAATTPQNGGNLKPGTSPLIGHQQQNKAETTRYFMRKTAELNAVKTTTHPNGQVIDWVPIESQGKIASPPPLPATPLNVLPSGQAKQSDKQTLRPLSLLELEGAEKGPGGTVPIPRQNLNLLSPDQSLQQRLSKPPRPVAPKESESQATAPQTAWPHWYANSGQIVPNLGSSGTISLFDAAVQNPQDFSLLQTAVIKNNVPTPGNPSQRCIQTVEAGWINYPAQVAQPHLFTYFNTNGYTQAGDYLGGWNTDVKGWVQVDTTIFPGTIFSPLSQDGGAQYEIKVQYQLYQGNWWLFVLNNWIGYYPASLFSNNEADPSQTLAQGADEVNWYGEIYQTDTNLTTTDMGSGEWPSSRWTHSAYINNITYFDTSSNVQIYDGSQETFASDSTRYQIETHYNSGTNWGSYVWLGGPGAGGQIGAQVAQKKLQR